MGLKDQIYSDFKEAMKSGDKVRKQTLKMLKSAVRNEEIDSGADLEEADLRALLAKQAKQRKESIEEFEAGGRQELADKEKRELEIINSYLPESLSESELEEMIEEVIEEVGAVDMSDMGPVMGKIMPKIRGRAEGGKVQQLVRSKLGD